jgi:hypothetical protein
MAQPIPDDIGFNLPEGYHEQADAHYLQVPVDGSVEALSHDSPYDASLQPTHADTAFLGYGIEDGASHHHSAPDTLLYEDGYRFANEVVNPYAPLSYGMENGVSHYHSAPDTLVHEGGYDFANGVVNSYAPHQRVGSEVNPVTKSDYGKDDIIIYEDEHGNKHKGMILHKSYSSSLRCDEYEVQRADTSRTVDTIGKADIKGTV